MAQKISAAKIKEQNNKMLKEVDRLEKEYHSAAIKYLNKQFQACLFKFRHNGLTSCNFLSYSPITGEDIDKEFQKVFNLKEYSYKRNLVGLNVYEVVIKRKEVK